MARNRKQKLTARGYEKIWLPILIFRKKSKKQSCAALSEIQEKDFNLNILVVDTFEEESP